MAAPVVSPVKRRRTAPAAPAQRAVTDVANVAAVHAAEPGSLIKIEAYMVFFHPLRRVAVRGVEKPIVSVVLADETGIVRLELWDGLAKGNISILAQADAKDGFSLVTVTNAQVCLPRHGSYQQAKQLTGVPVTTLQIGATSMNVNLSGIESSDVMAKDFSGLISMTCPFRVNLIGTIHEIDDEVKFTRDEIGQKSVILYDDSGFGVKLLCHGYWCEESMEKGQRWAICFGECRAEKGGEAVIWIFDSAYLLRLPDQDELPVFRQMLAW